MEGFKVGDAVKVVAPGGYASKGDVGIIEEVDEHGIVTVRFREDYSIWDRRFALASSLEKLDV